MHLADAVAAGGNLQLARSQMALSLGWHIIIACFGVAFPSMVLYAEWRALRRRDEVMDRLAHTWAKVMGVLFAVGAVSGTVLSFEMGMLWPGLMSKFGQVYGFPFTLEGFAFFIEAIFVGIYLFGWERLSPKAHLRSGFPMVIAGVAGGFFVIAANAWMNTPRGFRIRDGKITDINLWAAMFNPSTGAETAHMILAAVMVVGFTIASVYAVGMLRGRRDRYHRCGLLIPLTAASVAAPLQLVCGDWIAGVVADNQPVKLAAMEGLSHTATKVPLSIGGLYINGELRGAIKIPYGLSLLVDRNPTGKVKGLNIVPPALRPQVNIVHLSYNAMIGIGTALIALAAWLAFVWWRKRDLPKPKLFLMAVAVSGAGAIIALETGWITTEVGRQPWIVYQIELTKDAVSTAPWLGLGFFIVFGVYAVLTFFTVFVLRRLAHQREMLAPQDLEPVEGVSAER